MTLKKKNHMVNRLKLRKLQLGVQLQFLKCNVYRCMKCIVLACIQLASMCKNRKSDTLQAFYTLHQQNVIQHACVTRRFKLYDEPYHRVRIYTIKWCCSGVIILSLLRLVTMILIFFIQH